jgi:hypothetical protein
MLIPRRTPYVRRNCQKEWQSEIIMIEKTRPIEPV